MALLRSVAWRTPRRHYGPWEQVTGLLAGGLPARGVQVMLFATLDSITSAAPGGVCPRGYAGDQRMARRVWEAMDVSHALARCAEVDLVHSHLDWLPLATSASRLPRHGDLLWLPYGASDARVGFAAVPFATLVGAMVRARCN